MLLLSLSDFVIYFKIYTIFRFSQFFFLPLSAIHPIGLFCAFSYYFIFIWVLFTMIIEHKVLTILNGYLKRVRKMNFIFLNSGFLENYKNKSWNGYMLNVNEFLFEFFLFIFNQNEPTPLNFNFCYWFVVIKQREFIYLVVCWNLF